MASPFPEHGLTADLYTPRTFARPRSSKDRRWTIVAVVLGFVAVFLLQMIPDATDGNTSSTQEAGAEQGSDTYVFAVYMLNHTSRTTTSTSTSFTFDSGELPFTLSELEFGEFRGDSQDGTRYYAGMSLLARAEGQDAVIEFQEAGGKLIEGISYQGQSLVVLNGWETTSKDSRGKVINNTWGSMQTAAYDWREGLWWPEQGIVVEHPDNITVTGASLCIMVNEPTGATDVPELGPVLACALLVVVVIIARRART